ncbi:hypothetical protein [Paludibaculum fermentans]|uniref:hypothetical protein n=1 Tax=Paludibaculum fermentans TaxID=1473598 RepID=UPI003EB9F2DB
MRGHYVRTLFQLVIPLSLAFCSPLSAQQLLDSYTPDQLEKLGAARFQGGQPDLALPYYAKALDKDPARISSLVAAAGIQESGFRREQALALYRRALTLDPGNLDALTFLSRSAPTPAEQQASTRQLASMATGEQAARARMRLRELDALGGRPAFEVADTTRPYYFELEDPGRDVPFGMTFAVLVVPTPNGGRIRLLLSTATEGIWLRKSAAKALGARILFPSTYPWLDQGNLLAGDFGIIDKLELGELTLRNCPVFVRNASRSYMYGVDGIIGAEVFKDFLVEIGNSAADLSLIPFAEGYPAEAARYFVNIRRYGPFLLAPAKLDPEQERYFAVSNLTSAVLLQAGKQPPGVKDVDGGSNRVLSGWLCSALPPQHLYQVLLAVGFSRWEGYATSCKMEDLNRAAGFRVTGILGYSFLSAYTMVIDYRRGRIGFIPHTLRAPGGKPWRDPGEKWPTLPVGQ